MPHNRRTPVEASPVSPVTEAVIPTPSMVASAVRYPGKAPRMYRPTAQWQRDCYRHFEICGEARYAATYFGNALSRMTLYAAKQGPNGEKRLTSGPAYDDLTALFSGKAGQAQMLKAIGIHLTVAGECFLVGRTTVGEDEELADLWEVVSVLEMVKSGEDWTIHYGDGMADVPLTEQDVVIRIWTPHPAQRVEADSPFRSLLPILAEIEWLTKSIFKQISSRLTGSGVLFMSQGLSFPKPPEIDGKPVKTANDAEEFTFTLGRNMLDPVTDPESPAAAVPLVVTVPEGLDVDRIAKLLTFWSPLDEHAMALREEAIRRFAVGMDLEPEAILGMSSNGGTGGGTSNGVSHWGAWQIEESTIKMHIEPMAETIVNAITIGYLRPLNPTDRTVKVCYDSGALKLRPDRSKESLELNDRGILTDEAAARENGFSGDDLMTPEGRKGWLLKKTASGSATPDQVAAALKLLGVDLGIPPGGSGPDTATREARPDPTLVDHPTRPRTPEYAALLAASEGLVFRALERTGNRIRQKSGVKPPGVKSYEMHTLYQVNGDSDALLADAWSCAPQVLSGLVGSPDRTIESLNAYCKSLFAEQAPHSRERLRAWLEKTA